MTDRDPPTRMRLDKWLWAARLFKTRALAATAIDGGRVQVNGERVKRAKVVGVGDELRVRQGPLEYRLHIRALAERRGPAREAAMLFEEDPVAKRERETRALQVRFPGRYHYFGQKSFTWKGRKLKSTNQLLGAIAGVDGMKTGYIRASGYNLVASAKRGGRRVLVVVMGEKSGAARNGHVAALIDEYLPQRGMFAAR